VSGVVAKIGHNMFQNVGSPQFWEEPQNWEPCHTLSLQDSPDPAPGGDPSRCLRLRGLNLYTYDGNAPLKKIYEIAIWNWHNPEHSEALYKSTMVDIPGL